MEKTSFGIKSAPVNFREAIDTKDVDCAKVIAFDEKGRILTLVTADGISLPCDFLDMDDRDALDAAHRVAWEVACVTLGTLILLNTIDVMDVTGRKHRTLVVAARIARQDCVQFANDRQLAARAVTSHLLSRLGSEKVYDVSALAGFFDGQVAFYDKRYVSQKTIPFEDAQTHAETNAAIKVVKKAVVDLIGHKHHRPSFVADRETTALHV